jgi:hypothetical protein
MLANAEADTNVLISSQIGISFALLFVCRSDGNSNSVKLAGHLHSGVSKERAAAC